MIFPLALAIIAAVFPAEERGKALGIVSMIATFFIAAGPFVGGLFTELLSWRWIFWVNLPFVAAIGLIVMVAWREPVREAQRPRFDVVGLVVLIAGLDSLVLAVVQGPVWGWSDPLVLVLLAVGFVVLVVFVLIERRIEEPLVDMDLFLNATFSGSAAVMFTGQFVKLAVFVFGSLYLQDVLKMSPLGAGVTLLAAVVLRANLRTARRQGGRPLRLSPTDTLGAGAFRSRLCLVWFCRRRRFLSLPSAAARCLERHRRIFLHTALARRHERRTVGQARPGRRY